MAEPERQAPLGLGFAGPPLERRDNARAGTPSDMKPRHRVAVAHSVVAATLGPADYGKDPMPHRPQPGAFFSSREPHVGFCPALRPNVLVAIESRRTHP